MYKTSIILILALFLLTGCKQEPMYKVGQKVCIVDDDYAVGEVFKITKDIHEHNVDKKFTYHVKLYKPKLKGHVIVLNQLSNIREFIEIEKGK